MRTTKQDLQQMLDANRQAVSRQEEQIKREIQRVNALRDGIGTAACQLDVLYSQLSRMAIECSNTTFKLAVEAMVQRMKSVHDNLRDTAKRSYPVQP